MDSSLMLLFFFFKGSNRAVRRKSADFTKAENFLIVAREIFKANLLPVLSMNMHFLLPLGGGSLKTSESVRFQGTPVLMRWHQLINMTVAVLQRWREFQPMEVECGQVPSKHSSEFPEDAEVLPVTVFSVCVWEEYLAPMTGTTHLFLVS